MAARAEHRRSGFSLMPFPSCRAWWKAVEWEAASIPWRGCRGWTAKQGAPGESYAMPRRLGPHKGLSLALLADRFTTSPSNTILNVLRRIFRRTAGSQDFLSPSTDRRTKDPSRCSVKTDIFCVTFAKLKQFRRCPEFWWHMEGFGDQSTRAQNSRTRILHANGWAYRLAFKSPMNFHLSITYQNFWYFEIFLCRPIITFR